MRKWWGIDLAEVVQRLFKGGPPPSQYLEDPYGLPLGLAYAQTFPSAFVTEIYDTSPVKHLGQEMILGRVTERLEITNKHNETYLVNVDKETGILLRQETVIDGVVV